MEAGIALVWLLFWVLAAVGLTHVIADSHLAELWPKSGIKDWLKKQREDLAKETKRQLEAGLRKEDDPPLDPGFRFKLWDNILFALYCYQCSGFHVGFWTALVAPPVQVAGLWARLGCAFMGGCAVAFLAPLGAALINFLDVVRGGKE